MSSIVSDTYDYDIGDFYCSEESYGYDRKGDYGGYKYSHDIKSCGDERYYFGGEYEENGECSSYGEYEEDKDPCDSSCEDERA